MTPLGKQHQLHSGQWVCQCPWAGDDAPVYWISLASGRRVTPPRNHAEAGGREGYCSACGCKVVGE